jgi:hypothetical protein
VPEHLAGGQLPAHGSVRQSGGGICQAFRVFMAEQALDFFPQRRIGAASFVQENTPFTLRPL